MIKHKLISKNNNKSKKINQIIFKFMMTQKTVMNIQKILNINMMMKKMPKTRKMMITMKIRIKIELNPKGTPNKMMKIKIKLWR